MTFQPLGATEIFVLGRDLNLWLEHADLSTGKFGGQVPPQREQVDAGADASHAIDDLHQADRPSLLLLQFVAREMHDLRLLVVGTCRNVGLTDQHPLSETLLDALRAPTTVQLAHGFSEAKVAAKARVLLDRALATARELGMQSLAARTQSLRQQIDDSMVRPPDPRRLAYDLGRAFAERRQLDDLIRFAVTACRELLDAEGVAILLFDRDKDELYFPYVAEDNATTAVRLQQIRFPAHRGIAGGVLRSRTSVRVDDVSADPRFFGGVDQQTGRTTRALIGAPLVWRDEAIGVIEAVNFRHGVIFSEDDLGLLEVLAQSLAEAIGRLREDAPAAVGQGTEALRLATCGAGASGIFRKEGDYWTITYGGTGLRLKDRKGLHYIAQLLRHPGQEFIACDLVMQACPEPRQRALEVQGHCLGVQNQRPGSGNQAPLLDAKAKVEYRHRIEELREELDEAERFNDLERAARAREEMDTISQQLAAAIGLRGKDRLGPSDAERARQTVTHGIKSTVAKIRVDNPALARHLAATITTGCFCAYRPDPDVMISWLF